MPEAVAVRDASELGAELVPVKPLPPPVAAQRSSPEAAQVAVPQSLSPMARVLQRVRGGELLLPSVPTVVSEVRKLVTRPDSAIDDLVSLIERDQRMALDVLRLSNTPEFARRHGRNNDLKIAVQRIGFRRIAALVETICLRGLLQVPDPGFRQLLLNVWRHSLAKAVSMRAVAELVGFGEKLDADVAYLGGLLADIGASFLLWLLAERVTGGGRTMDPASLMVLQEHHEEIGAMVLERWSIGAEVTRIARTHHAGSPAARFDPCWNAVMVATELADDLAPNADITCAARAPRSQVDACLSELGLPRTAIEGVAERLRSEYVAILATLA